MINTFDISYLHYQVNSIYEDWDEEKIEDKEAMKKLIHHCKNFIKHNQEEKIKCS